ncbi:MAG: hypothetical protein JWR26_3922, partial [Pedosphaera sp.]|nr:hypothetical protein [Pedosphaera sp.]
ILYGSRRSRLKLRRKLLARNPMLWLTLRESRFVWAISLVVLYLLAWSIFTSSNITATLRTAASSQLLFVAGLMLWLASQACRFFVDASRNGALELLLVTPVGPEQIVRCQWTALRRTFLLPALLVIFMQLAGPIASILEMDTTTYATGTGGVNFNYTGMIISSAIAGVLKFLGNLAAVAWFGMWMGLTTRSTSMAIFKTLVFALALPALFLLFVQAITLFAGAMAGGAFWFGPVAVAVVSLAKNIFFIIWSRNRLLTRFREAVVREGHAPKYRTPPPLPLVVPPPLVSASVAAPPVPTNTEV